MGNTNLPASVALERRFQQRMLVCLLSLGLLGGFVQRYERALFVPAKLASVNEPSAFAAVIPPVIAARRNAVATGRLLGAPGATRPGETRSSPIFDVLADSPASAADAVTSPDIDSVGGSQPPTSNSRRNFFAGSDNPLGGAGGVAVAALPDPGAGGVPEPASWGLMILGVGLIGGALRRRRAKQSAGHPGGAATMLRNIA